MSDPEVVQVMKIEIAKKKAELAQLENQIAKAKVEVYMSGLENSFTEELL